MLFLASSIVSEILSLFTTPTYPSLLPRALLLQMRYGMASSLPSSDWALLLSHSLRMKPIGNFKSKPKVL